jgi:hypothetical protein
VVCVPRLRDVLDLKGVDKSIESVEKLLSQLSIVLNEVVKESLPLRRLVEEYEKLKGCFEEETWVRNKIGKEYYYWYIKCPDGPVKSIYLGRSSGALNTIKKAGVSAKELLDNITAVKKMIEDSQSLLNNVKAILGLLKREEEKE